MKRLFRRLARLARAHDNVVSRGELLAIGFTDRRIRYMVKQGHWQRLHPGVYLLGAAKPTWRQRARAAVKACGPGAYLSHASAVRWWVLAGADEYDAIHVTVPRASGPVPKDVIVHRPRREQKTVVRDRVRVTTIDETLLDFAVEAERQELECAVESALLSWRTTERRIWRMVALNSRKGVRGVALLRHVMQRRPNGKPARSVLELEVLDLIRKARLPLPTRNHDVIDGDGNAREIDLCYVPQRGAIEANGKAFHSTATQTERDKKRQRALEAVGYSFVVVTWADVFERPKWVVDEIRGLLRGSADGKRAQIRPKRSA